MKSARILIELNRSSSIHQKIDFIFFRDSTRWYYHLHTLMEMRATAPSRSRRRRCSPKEIAWHRDRSKYRIYSLKYTHTHTHHAKIHSSVEEISYEPRPAPPRLASPYVSISYETPALPDNAARIAALYIFPAQSTAKERRNLGKTFSRYRL